MISAKQAKQNASNVGTQLEIELRDISATIEGMSKVGRLYTYRIDLSKDAEAVLVSQGFTVIRENGLLVKISWG